MNGGYFDSDPTERRNRFSRIQSVRGATGKLRRSGETLSLSTWRDRPQARVTAGIALTRRRNQSRDRRMNGQVKLTGTLALAAAIITAAAIALVSVLDGKSTGDRIVNPAASATAATPNVPGSYLGLYEPGVPGSYAGVRAFTAATGVMPQVVVYYSGWLEKFQAKFAAVAASHDAAPLVQIDPSGINLQAIASGRYDTYLRSYASEVKAFGRHVIISFGHEMNGSWYSWGYQHTSPAMFVAAWRHIVTIFRATGARNVTWLWTINISQCRCHIAPPARWWPGNSYVNWVGIDGYYYKPSWKFASLFGPTIKAVRALTLDPILISETAAPAGTQSAKIPNLFAGIRAYGLLGFVWFDVNKGHDYEDWRISSPEAFAAFRRGAKTLKGAAP
jgi:mannan endo-1,4-beta-mannosidase